MVVVSNDQLRPAHDNNYQKSLQPFHSLGVLSDHEVSCTKYIIDLSSVPMYRHNMLPLGGNRTRCPAQSSILLSREYQAIQVSVTSTDTKYRCKGQVTGILFYPHANEVPHVLGQFTGFGERYDLREN